jgi:hypothetical protein
MRYDQTLLAILSDQDGKNIWTLIIGIFEYHDFLYIYIVYIYIIGLEVASWSICAN